MDGQKAKEQEAFFFFYFASPPSLLDGSRDCMPYLEAPLASTSTTQDPTSYSTVKQRDTRTKKGGTDLL